MELYDLFTTDDGSLGFNMPQKTQKQIAFEKYDKRTIDDYKILTKEIRDDYVYMLKEGLKSMPNGYASHWSPKGYFYQNGKYLEVLTTRTFGRSEDRGIGNGENRLTCVVFRSERIELYESDGYYRNTSPNFVGIARKLRRLGWDTLKEEGYVTKNYEDSYGYRNDNRYNSIKLYDIADSNLRDTVRMLFPHSNYNNLYEKTKLFGYRDFIIKDGKMHYFYQNREVIMKMGKGIKKMLKVYDVGVLNDEELKQTVDRVVALDLLYEMRVVSGDDIDKYYHWKMYCEDTDTNSLGSSCMRYEECVERNYFQVYKDNAKMLICLNTETNKIVGRAILWGDVYVRNSSNGDHDGDRVNIMDRIYGAERTYVKFFDWASENGYFRKRYQTYDNEYHFVPPKMKNGDEIELHMEMDIDLNSYGHVPYMDTFAWTDGDVVRNEDGFGDYSARDTDGSLYYHGEDDDY